MKKERLLIETSKLLLNEGQLEWLPSNPRTWTRQDLDKLKASIERDPDFLEDRPALIVPYTKGKFIVFGGNMRTAANQELNRPTMPAMKYIPETDEDRETIKRRALLDNGSFGAWDFDALANEWDDLPLTDWGIPAWNVEEEVKKVQKDEEKAAQVPFTEILGEEHNYVVLYFDNEVDWLQAQTLFDIKPVQAMPTRKDGECAESFSKRIGVGRVLNGAKALQKLLDK